VSEPQPPIILPEIPVIPSSETPPVSNGTQEPVDVPLPSEPKPPDPLPEPILRRSKRGATKPAGTYKDSRSYTKKALTLYTWFSLSLVKTYTAQPYARMDHRYMSFLLHDWDSEIPEGILPQEYFSYVSKNQSYDPDQPNFTQAMRSEQVGEWIKACEAKLFELHQRGTWTELHKKDLPPNSNILPGTWAFKVKRFPDGRFRKFKARYCVRGDK
jgi:hypothetical protein